ncbi:hypothetical protein [Algoriphagus machipongonensis]|uniref:Lipoprotein n=1 Tax=Algoriphagus machipongonensis TaxID=388413 RepID=A3HVJ1_9BACT|nr:hypothetical protein [Algoriphagus machipongonensis]EAZ82163.1 hypothetical protein ALPR1_02940 [Algoriphagus machipongonensis]
MKILLKVNLAFSVLFGLMACSSQKDVQSKSDEYDLINYLIEQDDNYKVSQDFLSWEENSYSTYHDFNPSELEEVDFLAINKELDLDTLLTSDELDQLKSKIASVKPKKLKKSGVVASSKLVNNKMDVIYPASIMGVAYPLIIHVNGGETFGFILSVFSEKGTYYSIYKKEVSGDWEIIHKAMISIQ